MARREIGDISFTQVYPLLVAKVERKGRTKDEVDEVIRWLTGYSQEQLEQMTKSETDYRTFFAHAPRMNPNAGLITGVVCGIRVENIEDPLTQQARWLDKLVDELAKGKPMDKVLRS